MSTRSSLVAALALAGALAWPGPLLAQEPADEADSGERAMNEVAEAYEAIRIYGYEKKEEAVSWSRQQLERLDAEIETLREEAAEAQARAEERWPEVVEEVEEQRAATAEQVDRLRTAGADVWEGLKNATAAALEELDRAIADAASDVEDEGRRPEVEQGAE